ncbi:toll/interleukin-1 receptor (TIR) domain-containing protein [Artemisia annua]|uniref:Toll/interleukin-1 receptor (TIR) domain-containing protein n=1 Tax=Artemisia annua TaxID=35608 RepID=A0A2U1KWT7_ARTAN|nr:toll/interleukin-1 receptor (TIR) domain-containing protein [Artemisia annua]
MASTSNASNKKGFSYDVFLSFRGEDTRNNFVSHLYRALLQKGIETYKDDEKIKKGETINGQLIKSIEDSRFYIIVFSKNYASSSWCLNELSKIMECQKTAEQTAYPVFYDVEPTEVRKQSGAVGEAFAKLEKEEDSGKWREAMKGAADLAGWELKETTNGEESKFIEIIVDDIFKELRDISLSFDGKLVGMETRIRDVISSLEIGTGDVRMIGIKGMGGGGKTTLARAVYDQIANHFDSKSFVENVREVSNSSLSGSKKLQKQVLSDVLYKQDITVSSVHDGINMMRTMMRGRKVLVVLDDVDHIDQLEALAGEPNWFKSGSRVIITTRDEQVLVAHRVNLIHNVSLLSHAEAICLFSRYAFGRAYPIQGYEELSRQVLQYAAGLPLTIKVLGSFLCGQNEPQWIDALDRLKTVPLKATMEKLELSYHGLEEDYKEIFLDVACILKGEHIEDVIRALESCGFHARNGLRVLEQKCLITISEWGYLNMHDHIEEMGKSIVRRLHPDKPNKHSRLWIEEEIKDILAKNLGTKTTRCMKLWGMNLNWETIMKGLRNMKKLRILYVSSFDDMDYSLSNWKFDDVGQYFPEALRSDDRDTISTQGQALVQCRHQGIGL